MSKIFNVMYKISRVVPGFNKFLGMVYSCDIPRRAQIGKNAYFVHNALGVVINVNAKIGDNFTALHHVTIGTSRIPSAAPVIGNNVTVNSYAMILGGVVIGDNVTIGAGSIVMHDIPPNTIYYNKRQETIIEKQETITEKQ